MFDKAERLYNKAERAYDSAGQMWNSGVDFVNNAKETRDRLIEENSYENGITFGRSAFRMAVINPGIDSYVTNAYGKVNFATNRFSHALKTGVYSNTSIAGGNMFGEKLGKWFFKGQNNLERAADIKGRYSFNFVGKTGLDASLNVGEEMGENLLRTGTGISRNYTGLFKNLSGVTAERIVETKQAAEVVIEGDVGKQVIGKTKRVAKTTGKVHKNVIKEASIIKETLNESLSKMLDEGNITKDGVLDAIRKQAASSPEELIKLQKSAVDAGLKVGTMTDDGFRLGINTLDELKDSNVMTKAVNDFVDLLDNKFFKATKMEKFFGNETMMAITGAGNLAGKTGFGIQMGLAATSVISSTHQEAAIQSSVIQSNFSFIKGEESLNSTSEGATADNRYRASQNDQELNYIISSSNNAESYRKDAGQIDIDRTKSKMENFTLY
ncbi:MAG: hypothetical protein ACRCX2_37000 [Paraclostridium sp.]